ncbi:MAG: histone deacetylase family protein [Thiohalobacteraceae bacterium]
MTIAYISHPDCLTHATGSVHPESAKRLWAIEDALRASRLELALRRLDAPPATDAQLLRVHSPEHLQRLAAATPRAGLHWLDADTALCPDSLIAARRAAGAGILGVDLLLDGSAQAVFCGVRPPGHHAERGRAMGGCLFNNAAVAAAHALEAHGLGRVAIVDFDVHYGNGTEQIFAPDPRVLFCSLYQPESYPHAEAESLPAGTHPHIVKVPLPAGADGAALSAAVESHWLPALTAFAPQLLLISAGFDGHAEDDLGDWRLLEADYGWLTGVLRGIADRHAQGRVLSMLEGGYEPHALGRCVVAHLKALLA